MAIRLALILLLPPEREARAAPRSSCASSPGAAEVPSDLESAVTVFIAEDNPILLQGLERALTANGYRVDTAPDGRAMLELLRQAPLPDILLLDVMMPGMSGIDVLDAVRSDARTAELPVVLITAAAEELVPGSGLHAREVDVLMKPFRLNELLERIQHHVGLYRQRLQAVGEPLGGAVAT
jgi:DNA-binding response OmpR family regulator